MRSHIHALHTAVPAHTYTQEETLECMKRWVNDRALRRMAHGVYRQSGIERRHSVLPDFHAGEEPILFRERPDGTLVEPGTAERNRVFEQTAPGLIENILPGLWSRAPGFSPGQVTHIITVSCTGFCNPGPDLWLAQSPGFNPAVQRYNIGFMGCYAAFPALRMADQFCRLDPKAVVLILCLELCSLHLQIKPTADSLLANSLFADGAAAALVSARPPAPGARALRLERFATHLLPEGGRDMAWTIGNHGFDMVLSSYVPRLLNQKLPEILRAVTRDGDREWGDMDEWAIHPGGRAILDGIGGQLGLGPDRLAHSYGVLRDYGNMSSATMLFVLDALMNNPGIAASSSVAALAFGPGITVEAGFLTLLGQATRAPAPMPVEAEPALVS